MGNSTIVNYFSNTTISNMKSYGYGFAIPLVIIVIAWIFLLHFIFRWSPYKLARVKIAKMLSLWGQKGAKLINLFLVLWWIFFSLPFVGFVIYGIIVAIKCSPCTIGIVIAIAPTFILLLLYIFGNCSYNGYKMDSFSKYVIEISVGLLFALTIVVGLALPNKSWEACAYVLSWPALLLYIVFLCLTRYHLSTPALVQVSQSTEALEQFISDVSSHNLENWTNGGGRLKYLYSLITLFVSVVENIVFYIIFSKSNEKKATLSTIIGFLCVDFLIIVAQYAIESRRALIILAFLVYAMKAVAITFTSKYWLVGQGFIYFVTATFLLTYFLSSFWQYNPGMTDESRSLRTNQGQDDLVQQLYQLNPEYKKKSILSLIITSVAWLGLTLVFGIELHHYWKDTSITDLAFGLTQSHAAILIGFLSFGTSFVGISVYFVKHNKGFFDIITYVFFTVGCLPIFICTVLWKNFTTQKEFQIFTFPVFFLISSLTLILVSMGYQTTSFKSFHKRTRITLLVLIILASISFLLICFLPFGFIKNKFIGFMIAFGISFICVYIDFCYSCFTTRDFGVHQMVLLAITVFVELGFSLFIGLIAKSWIIGVSLAYGMAFICILIFSILWTRENTWRFQIRQYLTFCIPCCITFAFTFILSISVKKASNVLMICILMFCFISAFLIFASTLYYLLQKNHYSMTIGSTISGLLMLIFSIAIIVLVILKLSEPFFIVTTILALIFVISFIGFAGFSSSGSSTNVIIYANYFIPVRRLREGHLSTLRLFIILFTCGFLSLYTWGQIASIWFFKPYFGILASSSAIVIFSCFVFSSIVHFDSLILDTLRFITDDVARYAITKAFELSSLDVAAQSFKPPPASPNADNPSSPPQPSPIPASNQSTDVPVVREDQTPLSPDPGAPSAPIAPEESYSSSEGGERAILLSDAEIPTAEDTERAITHVNEYDETGEYCDVETLFEMEAGEYLNISKFMSALKGQLYISGEVAFESAREELIVFFKRKKADVSYLSRNRDEWSLEERLSLLNLYSAVRASMQAEIDSDARYRRYIAEQEAERARKMLQNLQAQNIQTTQSVITHNRKGNNKHGSRISDMTLELTDDNPFANQLQSLRAHHEKFRDPDFHPLARIEEPNVPRLKESTWEPYNEKTSEPMIKRTNPEDIVQGRLGDCYFIAAMDAICQRQWLVESLFTDPQTVEVDAVIVKFHIMGRCVPVLVDTRLPFRNGSLLLARPGNPNSSWWFSIVEKAFAKYNGSFSAIDGGNSHVALYRLIGGFPRKYDMGSLETKEQIDSGVFFDRLLTIYENGSGFICAGSVQGSDTTKNDQNIVAGHAYTVLRVVEKYGIQLVQLRNTWAETEWTGDWSDTSPLWNDKMKAAVGFKECDDGIFWMSFKDFTKNFASLYTCELLDPNEWEEVTFEGEMISGSDDGASPTSKGKPADVLPQYLIRFQGGPATLRVIFEKAGAPSTTWVYFANNGGKPIRYLYKGSSYRSAAMHETTVLSSWEWYIEETDKPWTFLPCRRKTNGPCHWACTIYCNKEIEITPIDPTTVEMN